MADMTSFPAGDNSQPQTDELPESGSGNNTSNEHDIIKQFHEQVKLCTVVPDFENARPFVRMQKLQKWLTTPKDQWRLSQDHLINKFTQPTTPLQDILEIVKTGPGMKTTLRDADVICPTRESQASPGYLRLFCILLSMDQGYTWLLEYFVNKYDDDCILPFRTCELLKETLEDMLGHSRTRLSGVELDVFCEKLYQQQWSFCPRTLSTLDFNKLLDPQTIVPLHKIKILSTDSLASAYLVEAYEEFLKEDFLRSLGPSSVIPSPSSLGDTEIVSEGRSSTAKVGRPDIPKVFEEGVRGRSRLAGRISIMTELTLKLNLYFEFAETAIRAQIIQEESKTSLYGSAGFISDSQRQKQQHHSIPRFISRSVHRRPRRRISHSI